MTTMSGDTPRPGEIWRIGFAYEEDPSVKKFRPAIVAVIRATENAAVIVKVTGHGPRKEFPGEIVLEDWQSEGLIKPSTARCSKVAKVSLEVFRSCEKYGTLSPSDAAKVFKALSDLGILE